MRNLRKDYAHLSGYLTNNDTQNQVLHDLWDEFIDSLSVDQIDRKNNYVKSPDGNLPPTLGFTKKQMEIYTNLYGELDDNYKLIAGRTIGAPFDVEDDPIRVRNLYNILTNLAETDSKYNIQDRRGSMMEMEAAAVNLVNNIKRDRKNNYELRTQCRKAHLPISAPKSYTTYAKGLKLDPKELLKDTPTYLQSLDIIYNLFEGVEGFGAFADFQSIMGSKSTIENLIDSKIQTLDEFVDFLIVCAKYIYFDFEATRRENTELKKLLKDKNK